MTVPAAPKAGKGTCGAAPQAQVHRRRAAWDLKGQLSDVRAALGNQKEKAQRLEEENGKLKEKVEEMEEALRERDERVEELDAAVSTMSSELEQRRQESELKGRELERLKDTEKELREQLGGAMSHIGRERKDDVRYDFSFDRVFPPSASQEEVFQEISLLVQYEFKASFLEIYNESLRDLLSPPPNNNQELLIRRVSADSHQLHVPNLQRVSVANEEQVLDLLYRASSHRSVARTALNDRSSRSHSIFQLHIQGHNAARQLSCSCESIGVSIPYWGPYKPTPPIGVPINPIPPYWGPYKPYTPLWGPFKPHTPLWGLFKHHTPLLGSSLNPIPPIGSL
ncbi:carboxy-terminal kinesin 2-like [Coturnix japonica]|uniref:carboxy-terminal kinesin 2-like n=1 Tax=Coturnix japonica TaxID=93934 RepID=UPI0013A5C449|nr:carboxy-terminal kinesin 2-like [Coturnix japonica]